MPSPPYADGLTGRSNHRRNWLGQMVLQVEYIARVGHGGRPQPGKPTYIEVTRWRDATASDIRALDWFARAEQNKREGKPLPSKSGIVAA